MAETKTELANRAASAPPDRDQTDAKRTTSPAHAGKLREIVKEMKETTIVGDRIFALATAQKAKSPNKHKRPAVHSKPVQNARNPKSRG